MWKIKISRMTNKILENRSRGLMLSKFKTQNKSTVINVFILKSFSYILMWINLMICKLYFNKPFTKTFSYWSRNIDRSREWNSPEADPQNIVSASQAIQWKQHSVERLVLSTDCAGKTGHPHTIEQSKILRTVSGHGPYTFLRMLLLYLELTG